MLDTSRSAMKYQYQLNKQLADQNRNWQERMANTAHQREIKDLKAAGLNPVLSVTGGNGATTPSGSTASVSDAAGYFSALANLESARLTSAATVKASENNKDAAEYTADKNYETQVELHNTPGLNNIYGVLSRFPEVFLTGVGSLGVLNNALSYFMDENNIKSFKQSRNERKAVKGNKYHDIDLITESLLSDTDKTNSHQLRKSDRKSYRKWIKQELKNSFPFNML